MNQQNAELSGPDLAQGIEISNVPEGTMLLGHARGEAVLLVRRGHEIFALGAMCTHYGAPLVDGLLVGETVRCPWHHACFSMTSGESVRAPALNPVSCWRVEQRGGMAYVKERRERTRPQVHWHAAGIADSVDVEYKGYTHHASKDDPRYELKNARIDYIAMH